MVAVGRELVSLKVIVEPDLAFGDEGEAPAVARLHEVHVVADLYHVSIDDHYLMAVYYSDRTGERAGREVPVRRNPQALLPELFVNLIHTRKIPMEANKLRK